MSIKGLFREYMTVSPLLMKVFVQNKSGSARFVKEAYHYGPDKQQDVLIIHPEEGQRKSTTLFFCHGGGWRQGTPQTFRFVAYFFASLGYTTILAGYRKAPKHVFPAQTDDVANALKFGVDKLKEQGLYQDKVVLMGQSAGAHIVTYLAYSDVLPKIGFDKKAIKGVMSISGPINFKECRNGYLTRAINDFIGKEGHKEKADPYQWLNADVNIPILCIHGDCDSVVEPANSISFVSKINEISPGLGKLIIIKGGLHSNLAKLFWKGMAEHADMCEWIDSI
jgi:acetyl esterase/lipase